MPLAPGYPQPCTLLSCMGHRGAYWPLDTHGPAPYSHAWATGAPLIDLGCERSPVAVVGPLIHQEASLLRGSDT